MKKGAFNIKWKLLILCFFIIFLVATIGSFFTFQGIKSGWYDSIKPAITPPSWVFSTMWTILFFLIAISFYLSIVHAKDRKTRMKVYSLFGINFLLNILWSVFYFFLRKPVWAYFELFFLLISIGILISFTWKVDKKASWLLVPYFLWVGFAGILNYLSAFA